MGHQTQGWDLIKACSLFHDFGSYHFFTLGFYFNFSHLHGPRPWENARDIYKPMLTHGVLCTQFQWVHGALGSLTESLDPQ